MMEIQDNNQVTGITSIDNVSMLTLCGPTVVGQAGVNSRFFSALSRKGVSVYLVIQSYAENGVSVAINTADGSLALSALNAEFADEISRGALNAPTVEDGLAVVAAVGENLKHSSGVAGQLFSTLGRNGISVLACAQGSSEHNISLVVESKYLRKATNVIHESFLLSEYKELNVFVCGVGTVGSQLLGQIASQKELLMKERRLKINVVGIARSSCAVFDREGLDVSSWKALMQKKAEPMTLSGLRDRIIEMNLFNSVFVDCTASADVASLYLELLRNNVSVVAANKVAASSDYDNYAKLKRTALKRGVKFLYETNVGAGLPIIGTINSLRNSGDTIQKIEAVLSGTLNYIFNTISADIPFSRTVKMAQEAGYAEPDPRIDLSGKDVLRKLVILAREAGYTVNQEDVQITRFIPDDFFECSLDEFWKRLPELDEGFEKERLRLEKEKRQWRFVASMNGGQYSISLQEMDQRHPFYILEGSNNIVLLTTERYHQHPMLIQGYGAGAGVTAAGVFTDIMSIANI